MGTEIKKKRGLRVYLSHCIRGPKGENAPHKEIQQNIKKFKKVGQELQSYFFDWEKMEGFPKIDLYVPAEHDEFVMIAYSKGFITETEILDVDCTIIDTCDLLISWGFPKDTGSNGMKIECEHAYKQQIPIYTMDDLSPIAVDSLKYVLYLILKAQL